MFVETQYYSPPAELQGATPDYALNGGNANFANVNVSGITTLATLTVTGDASIAGTLTVQNLVVTANITVNGHIVSRGNAPQLALGVAAGTSPADKPGVTPAAQPAANVDGTDTAGTIIVTTGQTISEAGVLAEVTFAAAYDGSFKVALTPTNETALDIRVYVQKTTNGFKIMTKDKTVAASNYSFDYIVIGAQQLANAPGVVKP